MLKKNILNLGHKFYVKEKEFNLKPKWSYFHNFGRELQKTIVRLEISQFLGICQNAKSHVLLGLEFEKTVALSEMSSLEFVKMKTFIQNKKLCVWDKKYLILVVLGNNFKNIVIWNHHFRICENVKFLVKKKLEKRLLH